MFKFENNKLLVQRSKEAERALKRLFYYANNNT